MMVKTKYNVSEITPKVEQDLRDHANPFTNNAVCIEFPDLLSKPHRGSVKTRYSGQYYVGGFGAYNFPPAEKAEPNYWAFDVGTLAEEVITTDWLTQPTIKSVVRELKQQLQKEKAVQTVDKSKIFKC